MSRRYRYRRKLDGITIFGWTFILTLIAVFLATWGRDILRAYNGGG